MPMHKKRTWVVAPAESAEWLAEKLIGHSWCNCQGWSLGGHLFLNDQTSADGAFEVAVVKPPAEPGGAWWQIESITFSWLRYNLEPGQTATDRALMHINRCISGAIDPDQPGTVAWPIPRLDVETPEQHGRCHHCA